MVPTPTGNAPNERALRAHSSKAFNDEIDEVRNADKGTWNDTLNTAAFNLGQLVAVGSLDEGDVRQALLDASAHWNWSEAGTRQCAATIDSGLTSGKAKPRDLDHVGRNGHSTHPAETNETVSAPNVIDIEDDFWTCRDSLWTIYQASMARLCAPWAVLAYCVARALTLVHPHCTLPALVGGPGSLNFLAAITAPSGGGKDAAEQVSRDLVTEYVVERGVGSGEGLIDAYVKTPAKNGKPPELHPAIMFGTDEVDNLTALSNRSGNTLLPNLRTAFSANTLGTSNRKASSQHLEARSYRMTLVVSVQPERAGALLDDSGGGTAQRIMWFPAIDDRISADMPEFPTSLVLPDQSCWEFERTLAIPDEARRAIIDGRVRNGRGQQDKRKTHALFIREKFAFALAVLDGRDQMTEDDWRLAGIAMKVSDRTQEWVTALKEQANRQDNSRIGADQAQRRDAADRWYLNQQEQRESKLRQDIIGYLTPSGNAGMLENALLQKFSGRKRDAAKAMLPRMVEDNQVERIASEQKNRSATVKLTAPRGQAAK